MSQGSKPLGETSLSILELFCPVRIAADMGGSKFIDMGGSNASDRVNELVIQTEDIFILAISSQIASRQIMVLG